MDIVVVDQDVVRELNIFEEMVDTVGQRGRLTMYKCRKCGSEFTGALASSDATFCLLREEWKILEFAQYNFG